VDVLLGGPRSHYRGFDAASQASGTSTPSSPMRQAARGRRGVVAFTPATGNRDALSAFTWVRFTVRKVTKVWDTASMKVAVVDDMPVISLSRSREAACRDANDYVSVPMTKILKLCVFTPIAGH
jgi:hypothetical protein